MKARRGTSQIGYSSISNSSSHWHFVTIAAAEKEVCVAAAIVTTTILQSVQYVIDFTRY
jgi:hypothetical protein